MDNIFKNINKHLEAFFDEEVIINYRYDEDYRTWAVKACTFLVQDETPFIDIDARSSLDTMEVIFPEEDWRGLREPMMGDEVQHNNKRWVIKSVVHHNGDYRLIVRTDGNNNK